MPNLLPNRNERNKAAIAGGLVMIIVLIVGAVGVARFMSQLNDTLVAVPAQTVVLTPTPAPTKTVVKTVHEVPQSCLDALDDADSVIFSLTEVATSLYEAFQLYVDGLVTSATKKVNKTTKTLTDLKPKAKSYSENKAICRGEK